MKQIGILGCGVMGAQIAALFGVHGFAVFVRDPHCREVIEKRIRSQVRLSIRLLGMDRTVAGSTTERITVAEDVSELAECSLIIESVSEDKDKKRKALNSLQGVLPQRAIVVTNTSSLSVAELSAAVENPSRFLGLHFFNPVAKLRFAEVIRHRGTDPEVAEKVHDLLGQLGCHGIAAPDTPGFLVNRVLFAMIGEALRVAEETGVQGEALDQAIREAASHPVGPLELVNWLGTDRCRNVLMNLHERTGEEVFRPPPSWTEEGSGDS